MLKNFKITFLDFFRIGVKMNIPWGIILEHIYFQIILDIPWGMLKNSTRNFWMGVKINIPWGMCQIFNDEFLKGVKLGVKLGVKI